MLEGNKLYLVTGANGFVGLEVVGALLRRGCRVRAMVRDPNKAKELEARGVEVVFGDLQDAASLQPAAAGVYGVFHIGALFRQAGFPESVFHDINAEGTRRMLDAAIAAGAERFIHCSTVGVLGHVEHPPGTEATPVQPGDMYQRTKLAGEEIALDYFKQGKIRGVVIRPAMIYGPGDTRNLKLFRMIAKGSFFYVGDGSTHVHYVDVRDLAQAFLLAMEKSELNAEVYIIPGERAVPLTEMVNTIAGVLGVAAPKLHLPVKPIQWLGSLVEAVCRPLGIEPPLHRRRVDFFTKNRHFSAEKAARELEYKPAQSFEAELTEITRWYKTEGLI